MTKRSKRIIVMDVEFDEQIKQCPNTHCLLSDCHKINICCYQEAPHFLQDNPNILHGYRCHLSGMHCIKSLFIWSNESVNIWSHLIGFLVFFLLTFINNLIMLPQFQSDYVDHIMVSIGLVCYQFCMLCSAGYHMFGCHSERAYKRWLAVDLAGISLGIIGCYLPAIHFAFYCISIWRDIYMLLIVFLTCLILTIQLHPTTHKSKQFWCVRILLYCFLVGFGIVPTMHWVFLNGGFQATIVKLFFHKVMTMYGIGLLALVVYLFKIPERLLPGKFDFVGASHQLWHILVLLAFLYWHAAGVDLLLYRLSHACFA